MRLTRSLAALLVLAAVGGGPVAAQDRPLTAGADGVPVPKKTKHVQPVYPPEALAQGVRGIVILDLVIDAAGHVASASVVRSVPGLDEAAITAARQWEYEPVKVNGQPAKVSLTVPITFALTLPKLQREAGIPELRQGITPPPPAAGGHGKAAAEVTLEASGRIGGARILEGDEPWAGALLTALRTWRFAPPPEDATLSFHVEAEFPADKGAPVALKAVNVQRTDLLGSPVTTAAAAVPAAAPATTTAPPATTTPAAPAAVAKAPVTAPPPVVAPAAPTTVPAPAAPVTAPVAVPVVKPATAGPAAPSRPAAIAASTPVPATPAAPPAGSAAPAARLIASAAPTKATGPADAPDRTAPPPVEVITAPPPPVAPENGVSAIRDVTLAPGVPDLAKGRRPVMPPLARMSGASGQVEVTFSVSASGSTTVQAAKGAEPLAHAAEQTVASWTFRRARADRAYLVAAFTYGDDKASAVVSPQPAPPTPSPSPSAAVTTPSSAPGGAPATPHP